MQLCENVDFLLGFQWFSNDSIFFYPSPQETGWGLSLCCLAESLFFHWVLKVFERIMTDSGSALFRMRLSLDPAVATSQKRWFYKCFLKACGGFHGRHRPPGWGLSLCCLAESLFFQWFLKVFKEMLPILGHPFGPPSRKHKVFQWFLKVFLLGPGRLPKCCRIT